MLNCDITIELNGITKSFGSQQELDDFLSKNYNRVQAATQISDVNFSKDLDPYAETMAKLKAIKQENKDIISRVTPNGDVVENIRNTGKGFTGVTTVINNLKTSTKATAKPLISQLDVKAYTARQKNLITKELRNDPANKDFTDVELGNMALEQVNDIIAGWKTLGKMGTDLHGIAQMYFNDGITDPQQLLDKHDKPLDLELMVKYVKYLEDAKKEMIDRSGDPKMQFIAEMVIHDDATKIVGIIDLVGIDSNGNAYLGDFKTSYKRISEWDRAKTLKAEYQLAFYQQLMMSKGIPVAEMFIYPIYLKDPDTDNMEIGDLETEPAVALKQILYGDKKNIIERVNHVLPVDTSKLYKFKKSGSIAKEFKEMFDMSTGYDNLDEQVSSFLKTRVKQDEEGKDWYYDHIDRKRVHLPESATDKLDAIREYLENSVNFVYTFTNSRKGTLDSMIKKGEYTNLEPNATDEKKILLRTAFSRYMDGTWEIQDVPELTGEGVLVFKDKYSGVLEFVATTNLNLKEVKKLTKGTTLLGKFYGDSYLKQEAMFTPLAATEPNFIGLKILNFLNNNYQTVNAAGNSIGLIRVMNPGHDMGMVALDSDSLLANYKELMKKTGNTYNLDKVKKSSFENLLFSQVVHILKDESVDRDELSMIADIKDGLAKESRAEKLRKLKDIQRMWQKNKNVDINNIDYNSPSGMAYSLLNATIIGLQDMNIRPEDDINNVALNRSKMGSTPTELQSASSAINASLRPIKVAMQAMSDNYVKFNAAARKKFAEYYKYKNVSMLAGDHLSAFDNLYVRDADGKINKDFMLKDPYKANSQLDPKEREFVKFLLTTFNNYLRPNKDENETKASGEYFQVPLMRANSVSRSHNKSFLDAVQDKWKNAMNFHHIFEEEQTKNKKASEDMLSFHNTFNFNGNPEARQRLIDEKPLSDFDTNLELILGQLVFTGIRQQVYDEVLPLIHAVRVTSRLISKGFVNKNLVNIDDFIRDYIKVAVFDEKILEEAHEKVAPYVGLAKGLVTTFQLGLSPLNLVKETLQGQINNAIKLMADQYGKGTASMANYRKALNYVISDAPDFFNNVTMIEELNHLYGVANMDRHQLAEKMVQSKQGFTQWHSRWMLWASGAPDYLNRMSLFVAQMMEDGTFDAHSMVDGVLVYDWKKDKRFADYAAGRKSSPNYNKQRALYLAVLAEHNKDSSMLNGVQLQEGDALPRAYTTQEQQSLKMFSDYVHGPFDHENKIMIHHTLLGSLFAQFRTWLTAKKQQYTMAGDKYQVGSWEHAKDLDGSLLYLRYDDKGIAEYTTEVTDVPYMAWKGRFMEGLYQSIVRTYSEFKKSDRSIEDLFNFLKQDETIKGNFKMMSYDLMMFALISLMLKGLIDWGELKKDSPMSATVLNAAINSTSDLNPWANIKAAVDPKSLAATVSTITKTTEDVFGLLTGDSSFKTVIRNAGIGRTITDIAGQAK